VNINAVLQTVVPVPEHLVQYSVSMPAHKTSVHDVVAKDFSELTGHALQQLDVFPRKHAAMFVLGVYDANQSVLPAGVDTS
jgi:hypothetical protein